MELNGSSKTREHFSSGNYKGYYKVRQNSSDRLEHLTKEWFQNRTCLDIGSNDGQFCLKIAEMYQPSLLVGVERDHVLHDSAQSRLKRLIYEYNSRRSDANISTTEVTALKSSLAFIPRAVSSKYPCVKPLSISQDTAPSAKAITLSDNSSFPFNVRFVKRDIFDISTPDLNLQLVEGKYDIVTCFSVTKWVHLNGGDSKLLALFHKLFLLVRKGGRVILEYQPWKSYERNKAQSEHTKQTFQQISIRPEVFEDILVNQVGFTIECRAGTPLEQAKGFSRPILVLRRPGAVVPTAVDTTTSQPATLHTHLGPSNVTTQLEQRQQRDEKNQKDRVDFTTSTCSSSSSSASKENAEMRNRRNKSIRDRPAAALAVPEPAGAIQVNRDINTSSNKRRKLLRASKVFHLQAYERPDQIEG